MAKLAGGYETGGVPASGASSGRGLRVAMGPSTVLSRAGLIVLIARPARLRELLLLKRRRAHQAAHAHRLDRAARNQHERALLLQPLVQHVHRAQVERGGIVVVRPGGLLERLRDFHLRLTEDDASLLLSR